MSPVRPSDSHWGLITTAQAQTAHFVLLTLIKDNVDFVLGGGWAVWAHEPSTPSVDLDIYVAASVIPKLKGLLRPHRITLGAPKSVEAQQRGSVDAMRLDEPSERLGTGDPELYQESVSYLPTKLFDGRVHPHRLDLSREVALPSIAKVPVPDRASLAVAKMGALHDRSLAYRAYQDGAAMAQIGPGIWNQLQTLGQGYFLRKAGKDLFDVSVLLARKADQDEAFTLLEELDHRAIARETFAQLPDAIRALGDDFALRVRRAVPLTALGNFVQRL